MTGAPMMLDYYNDNDPAAAEWLRTLMAEGHIPPGRVDGRSILDVSPDDLAGVRRAHFFAGIAGWSEALRLADWPEWLPLWTGSPPCQPFSAAGKRGGRDDARHLGPRFIELVRAGRPPVLFGEQVASSDVFGPATGSRKRGRPAEPAWAWIDDLFDRLEAAGYAAWALDIPAAGVGAPHIRQRTYFGAVSHEWLDDGAGGRKLRDSRSCGKGTSSEPCGRMLVSDSSVPLGGLADTDGRDARAERQQRGGEHGQQPQDGGSGRLADSELQQRQIPSAGGDEARGWQQEPAEVAGLRRNSGTSPTNGFWGTADWLLCRDDKWRPVEPGTFPLAHGVSGRVGLLRGYGNAIVPAAAAEAIAIAREVMIETGIWGALRAAYEPEAAE